MFLDILAFMLLGIAAGVATGLLPGIHPNTVFALVVSVALLVPAGQVELLLVFIMSLAVSNTFVDFLPSIIFGAPEPSTALSVLPGHQLLLEGRGYEAVILTVVGGLGVASLVLLTLPAIVYVIPPVYYTIRPALHVLLGAVVLWMVVSDRNRAGALLTFLLAGAFGT